MITIAPIVEGHGDVSSIRVLLGLMNPRILVAQPVRYSKQRLLQQEHLIRAARIARANIPDIQSGVILILIDADADCAAELSRQIRGHLRGQIDDTAVLTVVAIREFESWICGGHEQLDLLDPDSAGHPKQRIRAINDGRYSETVDQPRFTSGIRVDVLRERSPSFARFAAKIDDLAN
jgi:hypothetical protein